MHTRPMMAPNGWFRCKTVKAPMWSCHSKCSTVQMIQKIKKSQETQIKPPNLILLFHYNLYSCFFFFFLPSLRSLSLSFCIWGVCFNGSITVHLRICTIPKVYINENPFHFSPIPSVSSSSSPPLLCMLHQLRTQMKCNSILHHQLRHFNPLVKISPDCMIFC